MRFVKRLRKFDDLKTSIVQEFKKRVSEAREEVEQYYSSYIQCFQQQEAQLLAALTHLDANLTQEITTCLKETEMHIYEDDYFHDRVLARNMATYCKTPIQPNLQVFMYERQASFQSPTDIERLIRAAESYLENYSSHLLVSLEHNTLQVYNCASGISTPPISVNWPSQSSHYTIPTQVEKYNCSPQWLLLGTSHILHFETNFASPALLNFKNAQLKPLPECGHFLCHRGLVLFNNYVYAFGGLDLDTAQAVQTVDRLNLVNRKWDQTFSMGCRRSHFTPCVHQGGIYLAGGCVNDIPHEGTFQGYSEKVWIERYYPVTGQFDYSAVSLPECQSKCFSHETEIVILQNGKANRYSNETLTISKECESLLDQSNCTCFSGYLYFRQPSGEISKLALDSLY